MSRQLFELVQFEQNIRKHVKDNLKTLKKRAKKSRKNKNDLTGDEARQQLTAALDLLGTYIDTAATKEAAELEARTDLKIDGDVLLENVPVRLLVLLRSPVNRIRKAAREVSRLQPDAEVSALHARAERLRDSIDRTIDRANGLEVEDQRVSQAILEYLR